MTKITIYQGIFICGSFEQGMIKKMCQKGQHIPVEKRCYLALKFGLFFRE